MGDDPSRLVARARIGISSGEGVLPRVIPSQGALPMFYVISRRKFTRLRTLL